MIPRTVHITVILVISVLVCNTALSEGRRIPPASSISRLIPANDDGIPSALTDLGCCSAANLSDSVSEPRGVGVTSKLGHGTRVAMMNPTAGNTAHSTTATTSLTTTAPGRGLVEASSAEATDDTETSHMLSAHRATDAASTTTLILEETSLINHLPVQLVVATITAFVTATALWAILFGVFAASSPAMSSETMPGNCLSGSSKVRLATLWSLLGRPAAHVTRLPDLEEAEGLCPTTIIYIDEPPRDDSDSSLRCTAALEEKSLLLLACQKELECLKAKLAAAEATLETSSEENSSLRSTLAETEQDLHETKRTSERRLAQIQEKNGMLSQAIKEHDRLQFQADIMALENRRQEEELLDAQDDMSALSSELMELSDSDEEQLDVDMDMSFQEWL